MNKKNKKNKNENNYVVSHSIDPVYDSNSEILVLGSFPSVKSRQQKFFYGLFVNYISLLQMNFLIILF